MAVFTHGFLYVLFSTCGDLASNSGDFFLMEISWEHRWI